MDNLEWRTIHYQEEYDNDGSILSVEWVEEAEYRNGFLVRTIYDQTYTDTLPMLRNESTVFVPK